jgi:activator of 2-hydroxyglutaryl-CoA dehydratase
MYVRARSLNSIPAVALGVFLGRGVEVLPEPQLNGAYGAALAAIGGA